MPAFTITKATSPEQMKDVARVFKLTRTQSLPFIPVLHTDLEDIEYFSKRVFSECEVHLAKNSESNTLAGFIAFRAGWIDHLYVLPQAQGFGLGLKLLDIAKAKFNELTLCTFKGNSKAQAFYQKHGFTVVRETDGSENEEKLPDVLLQWKAVMNDSQFKIRLAEVNEAHVLSEIAIRSKSHWPYDEDYLALCRSVTHVTSEDIEKWPFIVATLNGRLCGFSAVCEVNGEKMLDHLWIDPEFIGKGIGRVLFAEGVARAKALGWSRFTIASDPYAEEFYKKMGAKRIGERESKVKKGFFLPLLEFHFT